MTRPVLSFHDLAWRLRTRLPRLYEVANSINNHYFKWERTNRRTGVVRTIRSPSDALKEIQKRIGKQVFHQHAVNACAHGGVKQRSTRTNASAHLGQKCVINLDARAFYPSVDHHMVYALLVRRLGMGRDVAALVTRLVTHQGQLVQGAPTSVVIANLLLREPLDEPTCRDAQLARLNYTRYIDDITISGSEARQLINPIAKRLSRVGVRMHRYKTKFRAKSKLVISSAAERQEVTGLVVNGARPTVSKSRRDLVRCAINELRQITDAAARERQVASILGRIAYVRQFHEGDARRLSRYLEHVLKVDAEPKSNAAVTCG